MQPGHAATLRAEEEMRQRWERSDRFETTKGNLVKANTTETIEATPMRSREEIQRNIVAQKSLATMTPEEL
eukprot:10009425-Karenia_brevis.AAC.1